MDRSRTRISAVTRRAALSSVVALGGVGPARAALRPRVAAPVELSWLGDASPTAPGAAVWGVPWPHGALSPKILLKAIAADGSQLPLQTWPLAYWPDGSIKFSGHAVVGAAGQGFRVEQGKPAAPQSPLTVKEEAETIEVRAGAMVCRFARGGATLIHSIAMQGRETARGGRLVCLSQTTPPDSLAGRDVQTFDGLIERATVEQRGPVRAVVRFEGRHRGGGRDWVPFTVRVAVDTDGRLTLTHSFVFDGDANSDFICGLGVRFDVPFSDELHNRHVRFAGEGDGLWGEAVRNLPGWQPGKFSLADRFPAQLRGDRVPTLAEMDTKTRAQLETVPAWDGFRLFQSSSDAFSLEKRTGAHSSWLRAGHGGRASGLVYVGGVSGGLACGVRDFWQRHPTGLEIQGASGEAATVTLWFWSPQAGAMDLRHYSDRAHGLEIQYEDFEPGHSTPLGVARTNQVFLWPLGASPRRETLAAMAAATREPALPICKPDYYQSCGVFGVWSPVDRSTPARAQLEAELDRLLAFYRDEIDQRRWYGFWDHGDVMHGYDADRHVWRYDVGGFAWANSELVPDLWLWTSFLRSGRADVFRMAEAMTRHTGEVDVHHLGPFKGLGSRHNVSHWGDSAKELRISQALLRRPYYYLTADERTGDLMTAQAESDKTLLSINPVRKVVPATAHPTQARTGPDWLAMAGNWMTAWERTGDRRWRDRIVRGFESIAGAPHGMFSGPAFGYDPATGQLEDLGRAFGSSYHLVTIMGGAEAAFELDGLIDHPAWRRTWLQFCAYYNAPQAMRQAALGPNAIDRYFAYPAWHARLTAWAASRLGDPKLAARAWHEVLTEGRETARLPARTRIAGPQTLNPVEEITGVATNNVSQWSLNVIELLALVGDALPVELPKPGLPPRR